MYVCEDEQSAFAQDTGAHAPKKHFSHVQMCTHGFTVLPDGKKEHWKCMLCMRLSSQLSVDYQTQHRAQSAFHGCSNRTDHEGFAFFAQDPRPDIASPSGSCHQWHKTLTTDVTRSKHVRSQQLGKQRKRTRNLICLHCLRRTKTLHRKRENQKTPRCAPMEGRVRSTIKTVHRKTGATGSCVNVRRRKGLSVHVRCRFADATKTLPHVFT